MTERRIRIIREEEITVYPEPERPVQQIAVTYVYEDYPPRTLFIDKEKYTMATLKMAIKEDIERLEAYRPKELTI